MLWLPHNTKKTAIVRSIVLLAVIQLFFLLPLLKPGIFHTHDGILHMARIAAYSQALADGQFPVRWSGNLNYGYGSPLFIFYYPLPYIVGSLFRFLGTSFTGSFKLLLALSFVFAPVSFYIWIRRLATPLAAFAASLLYGLAPYHFLDLYVRGDIGELFAFMIIPVIFWSIEASSVLAGALLYALLILSHNAFALLFSPIFIFYAFVRFGYQKTFWKRFALMLILGLGISAFFWLPALVEQKYTNINLFVGSTYKGNFPSLTQLIWSPWGFGTKVNAPGGLSPQIGLPALFFTLLAIVFSQRKQKLFLFGFIVLALGIFFSLKTSSVAWDTVSFLQKLEFPWRFTAISVFATGILAALVLSAQKLRGVAILSIPIIILASLPFVQTTGDDTKSDDFYRSFPSSTEFGAASTIWSAGDPSAYPKEPVSVIVGDGKISNLYKGLTAHTFTVNALTNTTILDNTLYFPGWSATVDSKKVPIEFQDANYRGLITFPVSKGNHNIEVRFGDSPIRAVSNIISVASVIVTLILAFGATAYIIKL